MNKTIKTHTKISKVEALQLLVDNNGNAVSGLAFRSSVSAIWYVAKLVSVNCDQNTTICFSTKNATYPICAKVTELDPCKAPSGCPELAPWQAFVGNEVFPTPCADDLQEAVYAATTMTGWENHIGAATGLPKAIDVRTAWAKEHFPEHCRIRAYVVPDPFDAWFHGMRIDPNGYKDTYRQAYELGQANPTKGAQ